MSKPALRAMRAASVALTLLAGALASAQEQPPAPSAPQDDPGAATNPRPEAGKSPDDDVPFELRVNRAVDRACRFLLGKQNADGSWHVETVHPIGRTSLALLALLHGGVNSADERITKGVDWLIRQLRDARATRPSNVPEARRSVYETSVTLNLLYALGPNPRYVGEMQPLVDFLARTFRAGEKLWGYPEGEADLSNSGYALLGLRSAQLRGVEPQDARDLWLQSLKGVLRCHTPMGGFSYKPGMLPRGSMTVAGLTMIKLCDDALRGWPRATKDLNEAHKASKAAEAWFLEHLQFAHNPEGRAWTSSFYYYYLYAIERYAVICDLKRLGERDWYREGAETLLADQNANGSWGVYDNVEDAAFAVLFLRKAALTMPEGRTFDGDSAAGAGKTEPVKCADDVPYLRTWLVCGSFAGTLAQDDMLAIDHIGEARARPAAKRRAGKSRWMPYTSGAEVVDLWDATSSLCNATVKDNMACYAAVWLHAEAEVDAALWLWSDDGSLVFLDGEMIFDAHHHEAADFIVPLRLAAGAHCLMLKVENLGYDIRFKARLATPEGLPLDAISVDLDAK